MGAHRINESGGVSIVVGTARPSSHLDPGRGRRGESGWRWHRRCRGCGDGACWGFTGATVWFDEALWPNGVARARRRKRAGEAEEEEGRGMGLTRRRGRGRNRDRLRGALSGGMARVARGEARVGDSNGSWWLSEAGHGRTRWRHRRGVGDVASSALWWRWYSQAS